MSNLQHPDQTRLAHCRRTRGRLVRSQAGNGGEGPAPRSFTGKRPCQRGPSLGRILAFGDRTCDGKLIRNALITSGRKPGGPRVKHGWSNHFASEPGGPQGIIERDEPIFARGFNHNGFSGPVTQSDFSNGLQRRPKPAWCARGLRFGTAQFTGRFVGDRGVFQKQSDGMNPLLRKRQQHRAPTENIAQISPCRIEFGLCLIPLPRQNSELSAQAASGRIIVAIEQTQRRLNPTLPGQVVGGSPTQAQLSRIGTLVRHIPVVSKPAPVDKTRHEQSGVGHDPFGGSNGYFAIGRLVRASGDRPLNRLLIAGPGYRKRAREPFIDNHRTPGWGQQLKHFSIEYRAAKRVQERPTQPLAVLNPLCKPAPLAPGRRRQPQQPGDSHVITRARNGHDQPRPTNS